ncbi:hypothetical protein [Candidatus Regiella endosymbiont of Tuberolachnus salignus]|uniref:hypothetical protein n=1 Tax=Candidatus Regiella endosymbiont of Tuberolachnus salignus TaxID=3077956 RepID=UPI0030D2031C
MRIQESDGELVDIYAVYIIDGDAMCLGLPKNYGGLRSYKMKNVTVIDPALSGDFIYFHNNGYGIYHLALIKERLLDDLLELDETAYQRFLEILKAEGRIEADFY